MERRGRDAVQARRLKELAAACQREGMPLGFYYSQSAGLARDRRGREHVGLRARPGPDGKELKDYDGYLRGKAEPQVGSC